MIRTVSSRQLKYINNQFNQIAILCELIFLFIDPFPKSLYRLSYFIGYEIIFPELFLVSSLT